MNRKLVSSVTLGIALLAGSVTAQSSRSEAGAVRAAQTAEKLVVRADRMCGYAQKSSAGTTPWRRWMAGASRLLRTSFRTIDRYERFELSPAARARLAEDRRIVRARLSSVYRARANVYAAHRRWRAVRRLALEVRRIDATLAKTILEVAKARTTGRKTPTVTGTGTPGRNTKRPTPEELRWLGRRGYRPAPRTPPRPARPARRAPAR